MWPELMGVPQYRRYEKKVNVKDMKRFSKRIVLISDTHISFDTNPSFNSVMYRKGIEEITKIRDVDYIIHLGDLVHDGTYLEYQIALDLIRKINHDNFYIIPGNHDARNVGYLLFEEEFGNRTFLLDDPDLYVLGVDSSIPDQNAGKIGKIAIEKSQEEFRNHSDQVKILCFHHQTIPIPYTGRERSAIYDGGDVLEMALKTNVDLILNGHRHITNAYSCTDGDSDLVIFNCGTLSANKTRYQEMFTYTVLDINEKMAKFTTKKLLDGSYIERWRYIKYKFQPPKINPDNATLTLIHIGNTHFNDKLFNQEIYNQAVHHINSYEPDMIFLTGSVTASNQAEEYAIANQELAKLKAPLFILPGFKDLKKYGWNRFSENIGDLNPKFENDKLRVIGLNTVDPHLTNGTVGRNRMRDICEYFHQHTQKKLNIIATNHRLIPFPRLKFEQILEDSGSVLKNFTDPANNIDLILNGKNNIGFSLQLEETTLSFCGSISSNNTVIKDHHSFNIIKIYPNGAIQVKEHVIESNESLNIGNYWH